MGTHPRHVRGILFVDYVRMVRRQLPAWREVLSAADVAVVSQKVDAASWYPMADFERLGLAILEHVVRGERDAIRLWGRESVKSVLQFFPDLTVIGDPRESIMRFQTFLSALFDFPAITVEGVDDEDAAFRIAWGMSPLAEEAATWQAIGFFEELVTASGGMNVRTKLQSRSWIPGEPPTEFTLHWEPGAGTRPRVTAHRRVLVVDDEVLVGRALSRVLSSVADVTHAIDADEALRRLALEPFDVVIADYTMPGRDGVSLLAEVARRWPHVRRVLHTARVPGETAADALLGELAHEILDKPAPGDVLIRAVLAGEATGG
ncbi:MAG: response regulator [Myxococcota bacterium]